MSATSEWVYAGIEQEILLRVLPAVRHDLLGALTTIHLTAHVMLRKLASNTMPPEQCVDRVQLMLDTATAATDGIRALRRWDPQSEGDYDICEVAEFAIQLMQENLRVRQLEVRLEPSDAGEGTKVTGRFLYGVLSVLCLIEDTCEAHARLVMRSTGYGVEVEFLASSPAGTADPAETACQPHQRTFDTSLVSDYLTARGMQLLTQASSWRLVIAG
ncbi:MAG: hypothetical protein H6978_08790 [Gammaproteobacteria bacterium]|nr:hypothetical protein [Gammaproteobacteria bacterium]